MKRKISNNNPFGYNRYGYAFENIKEKSNCLDYGCFDGSFIMKCKANKNIKFIGVDKNYEIIKENRFNQEIFHIQTNNKLPFSSETFDCITILDVIEHIYDQDSILLELNRILKPNGKLIITCPGKHFFSFLDTGNYKFIFPKIHKLYYVLRHSKKEYILRFQSNPNGLIGDIEKKKSWHQHFSKKDMTKLLEKNGFRVIEYDGSGLFVRVLILLSLINLKFKKLIIADMKKFHKAHLFCLAQKQII